MNNNPTNENTADSNDAWLDELIEWAEYEYSISEEDFPRDKEALLNLTSLSLDYNALSTLPESIGNLTNLTRLDLSSNQLDTLPESIGNLTNLTYLDLSDNELDTLPESIGNLTNLTSLDLSDNELDTLPESFGKLTNLTSLDLSDNELDTLPESIGNLTNLTVLNLEGNNLDTVPESIGKLPNLNHLDLSNNSMSMYEFGEDEIYSSKAKALRYYENNLGYFNVDFEIPPAKTTLVWYETYTKTREFSTELTEEEAELFEIDEERFFREVKYTYNQNLEWERVVEDRTHDFELK